MRHLQVLTFCFGCCSIALGQASTVTLSASASSDGFITANASANPYNPQGCSNPSEPNNIGSISISVPGNDCTTSGEDLDLSCGTTYPLGPGTYSVSASYSGFGGTTGGGASCSVGGASASVNVVVPLMNTATAVQLPSSTTLQVGQTLSLPVTVSTTVSNPQYLIQGPVTLYYGSRAVASQPLTSGVPLASATITASTRGLPTGTYQLSVNYPGSSYFAASASSAFTIILAPAHMASTTSVAVSPNPIVKYSPANITVSVTPTGPNPPTGSATLLLGSTKLATVSIANGSGILTLPASIAPGTYSIQALYSGDGFNLPSTSSPVSVTVVAQTPTTTLAIVSPGTIIQGQTAQISTSVTPQIGNATPTGTVTITANGEAVTTLPLKSGTANLNFSTNGIATGTYSVVGTYNGSATDTSSASAPQTVIVVPASTLALTASPNPVKQGTIATLTAVVKTGTGSPVTSGTITFSYAGNILGTANLNSSGTSKLPIATSSFATGAYTIQASYPGSGNIPAAMGTVSLVVN